MMDSTAEATLPPPWEPTTCAIACEGGTVQVAALVHPWCPGLAVTMPNFGTFRVTHVPSGFAVGGRYERAGNAGAELVGWAAIARANDFDWANADGPAVAACIHACADQPIPFDGGTSTGVDGTRPLTVREWVGIVSGETIGDEFPWEDESPWQRADGLLSALSPAT